MTENIILSKPQFDLKIIKRGVHVAFRFAGKPPEMGVVRVSTPLEIEVQKSSSETFESLNIKAEDVSKLNEPLRTFSTDCHLVIVENPLLK